MSRSRSELVDVASTPYYHCVSRCVRRAFLCGNDPYTGRSFEHRKQWLVDRLRGLSDIFAVDVCAYAVMSNHFHLVLRVDREAALAWSDEEVIERYQRLFKHAKTQLSLLGEKQRTEKLATWRERLWDLSWMMRSLNEYMARRANKEDDCTGRFWEGRFKSQPLLGSAAVLTCMAYVDLNPVRAGAAKQLGESDFTSIGVRLRSGTESTAPYGLAPFADQVSDASSLRLPMLVADYVQLLEWTGRAVLSGKGRLSGPAPAELARLAIEPEGWLATMSDHGLSRLGALGRLEELNAFAQRHQQRWMHGNGLARRLFHPAA